MKIFFKITTVILCFLCFVSCDDSNEAVTLVTEDITIEAPVIVRKRDTLGFLNGVSNAGEVTFSLRSQTPENSVKLGVRFGEIIVESPENFNINGIDEINLEVEVKKSERIEISNVTILKSLEDLDGDGVLLADDSNPNDPCLPVQNSDYTGYNISNTIWANADCDSDGTSNIEELDSGTNPYLNEALIPDTDGDGLKDNVDPEPNDPCIPAQLLGYKDFDSENEIWANADCDGDGVDNGTEVAQGTSPYPFPNLPCNEIFNFELENYERELRTVDSNNGEGVTIGVVSEDCGTIIFTGGGILNQGCFNEDVRIPFILTPSSANASSGTVLVELTKYTCLAENRVDTREFSLEGIGTYNGPNRTVELTYTSRLLENDVPIAEQSGTLIIRPL